MSDMFSAASAHELTLIWRFWHTRTTRWNQQNTKCEWHEYSWSTV